jgi:hypothetical protein
MSMGAERYYAFGRVGERLIARVMGGRTTRPNHPVDVVTATQAIEVKTLQSDAATLRTYMRRPELVRKNRYARENGLEPLTVLVVVYPDRFEVWSGPGFRNYDVESMHYVGAFPK